jgi:hypothetical protein
MDSPAALVIRRPRGVLKMTVMTVMMRTTLISMIMILIIKFKRIVARMTMGMGMMTAMAIARVTAWSVLCLLTMEKTKKKKKTHKTSKRKIDKETPAPPE